MCPSWHTAPLWQGPEHTRRGPAHRLFQHIQQGRWTQDAQGPWDKSPGAGRSRRSCWQFHKSSRDTQGEIGTESSFYLGCSHKWHFLDRGWGIKDLSCSHSLCPNSWLCLNKGNCCLLQNHGMLNCLGKIWRGTWSHFYCKGSLQGNKKCR